MYKIIYVHIIHQCVFHCWCKLILTQTEILLLISNVDGRYCLECFTTNGPFLDDKRMWQPLVCSPGPAQHLSAPETDGWTIGPSDHQTRICCWKFTSQMLGFRHFLGVPNKEDCDPRPSLNHCRSFQWPAGAARPDPSHPWLFNISSPKSPPWLPKCQTVVFPSQTTAWVEELEEGLLLVEVMNSKSLRSMWKVHEGPCAYSRGTDGGDISVMPLLLRAAGLGHPFTSPLKPP